MGNKISTYTAITTLANGDLLDISKDMGASTYATRKITYANLLTELNTDLTFPVSSNLGNANLTADNVVRTYTLAGTSTEYLAFLNGSAAEILKLKGDRTILIGGYTTNGFVKTSAGTGLITVSTQVSATEGGTGISSYTTGDILYSSASNTLAKLAAGTNGHVLTLAAGVPSWAAASNLGSANLTSSDDARTFTLKTGTTATQNFQIKNSAGKTGLYFDGVSRVMLRTSTVPADIGGEPVNLVLGDTTNEITCNMYLTTTGASQYTAWRIYSGSSLLRYVDSRGAWVYRNMNDNSKNDVTIQTFGNGPRITTDSNNGGYWYDGYLHTHGANQMVKIGTTGSLNGYIIVNNSSGTVKNIISGTRSVEPTWFGEGAQIGGTKNSINASALLDLQSTTQGLGLPSMTTAQKNAISSPRAGLLVFDDDLNQISYYTGAAWVNL